MQTKLAPKNNRLKTSGSGAKPPKNPRKKNAAASPDPYDSVTRVDLPHITLEARKLLKPYEI